jgi:hypothetical protein
MRLPRVIRRESLKNEEAASDRESESEVVGDPMSASEKIGSRKVL